MTKRFLALALLWAVSLAHATEPSVLVNTAAIERHALAETLTGYGRVSPEVGSTVNVNLPRPGQVTRLLVATGEVVSKGAPLLEFDTGAAAALAWREAQNALALAREDLARTEQMAAENLATQSQLAAARKALADAQAAVAAQRARGAERGSERIEAPFDGIVQAIAAAQGDRLAAGATVMRLTRRSGLVVRLGIEPEDAARIAPGMSVRVDSVFDAQHSVEAKVAQVHGMVDPQTQLVDAVVRLHDGGFIPGMRVRGVITLDRVETWAVPRSAVLRDDRGAYIFQVAHGHARRVAVRVGAETDRLTGIEGDFEPALPVVILGNYELIDGMAVREAPR